ncbi:MAG: hypothetical protein WA459_14615 [Stellaceae bacterium]
MPFFSQTSWRFFSQKNLNDLLEHDGLYLAYVLSHDDGFKGDMFIFKADEFVDIVRRSDQVGNGNYRVYISAAASEDRRWFVRRTPKFNQLNDETVIEVSKHYRDFERLG